jgi:hypothetical protein
MADVLRRPIACLPWLKIRNPVNVGDVRFGTLQQVEDTLSFSERTHATVLARCFYEKRGPRENGTQRVETVEPLFGVASGTSVTDEAQPPVVARLLLASAILGACVLQEGSAWPAESLQPYLFLLSDDHARPFVFPLANGDLILTNANVFTLVAPPYIPPGYAHVESEVAAALANLLDDALGQRDSRSSKTLSSLPWFVESQTFGLNMSPQPQLIALGTALEVLLDLGDVQDKTKELGRRVHSLCDSDRLTDLAKKLYCQRSTIVHAGQSQQPRLENSDMTYLEFGQRLFWLCLRATLSAEHGYTWQSIYGLPAWDITNAAPRLERAVVPNQDRLTELATMGVSTAASKESRQERVVRILQGFHENQPRGTQGADLIRSALTNMCLVLAQSLENAMHGQEAETANSLGRLAQMLRDRISNPTYEGSEIADLVVDVPAASEPGIYIPIFDKYCLVEMLGNTELVGGLCTALDQA